MGVLNIVPERDRVRRSFDSAYGSAQDDKMKALVYTLRSGFGS